jgi:hypothetical protein
LVRVACIIQPIKPTHYFYDQIETTAIHWRIRREW